jgi:hypothetical protein
MRQFGRGFRCRTCILPVRIWVAVAVLSGTNDDERDKTQANYTALAGVIRDVLSPASSVEIFTCWEGDHGREPEFLESVSVSELILPEFELKERQFLRVMT